MELLATSDFISLQAVDLAIQMPRRGTSRFAVSKPSPKLANFGRL
jgi:hypothetical protein